MSLGGSPVLNNTPPAPVAIETVIMAAPQGKPMRPSPSAGTPEPATFLLLAGGAVGYGVLRFRRRKNSGPEGR
jgi:hypothetical protein